MPGQAAGALLAMAIANGEHLHAVFLRIANTLSGEKINEQAQPVVFRTAGKQLLAQSEVAHVAAQVETEQRSSALMPGGGSDGRLNLFSNAGTTPNYCSVEYNMWFYPDESLEDVRAEVEDVVAAVCSTDSWLRVHPPRFTWKLGQIYFPPLDVPLDHPAVRTLADCLGRVGLDPAPQGFGAATDLAWYGERSLPGIICGPGRLAQCHVADEFLETEQLGLAATVYALMLTEWCG